MVIPCFKSLACYNIEAAQIVDRIFSFAVPSLFMTMEAETNNKNAINTSSSYISTFGIDGKRALARVGDSELNKSSIPENPISSVSPPTGDFNVTNHSDSDQLDSYIESVRNSEPNILTGSTHEWITALPSGYAKVLVQYLISIVDNDEIMRNTYKVFSTTLRLFYRTRTGCWYRAAFIRALSSFNFVEVPEAVLSKCVFVDSTCVEPLLVPIFVDARVQATLKVPLCKKFLQESSWVDHQELAWLVRTLLPLKNYVPKLFPKERSDDVDVLRVLSFAVESRVMSQLLRSVVYSGSHPKNKNASLCQQITGCELLANFFREMEAYGAVRISNFPLREIGAYKHAADIAEDYLGFENQMLSGLWKAAQAPVKIGEAADEIKNVVLENKEDVRELVRATKESSQQVNSAMLKLQELLEPAFAMMDTVKEAGVRATKYIKLIFDLMMNHAKLMFPIFSFIIVVAIKQFVGPQLVKAVVIILGLIALFLYGPVISETFSRIVSYIFKLEKPTAEEIKEDDVEEEEWEEQNADDVVVLVTSMYLASGVDYKNKKDIVDAFKAIPSMSKGVELVYKAIVNFFMKIASVTSAYTGMEPEFADWLDAGYGKWLRTTLQFMGKQKASMLDTTNFGADALLEHINTGLDLATTFETIGKRSLASLIMQNVKNLQSIHAEMTSLAATGPKERAEPVSIVLSGGPGHGKSTLGLLLAHVLVRLDFREDKPLLEAFERDPKRFIHQRGIDKWFEAYHPDTRVLIRDEFPATKETTPEDSPFAQLLDEIGVNAKPLPMANADLKGKVYYNHAYSIITSNKTQFLSTMLQAPSAITRRLHLVINVESKGTANHKKGEPIDINNWVLTIMRCSDDQSVQFVNTATQVTFEELVTIAAGIRNLRQFVLRRNTGIMTKIAKDISERVDNTLYAIASKDYQMQYKVLPDYEQLVAHLRENYENFLEIGIKKEAIDALIEALGPQKGKGKVPQHPERARIEDDDVPELIYPSNMENQAGPTPVPEDLAEQIRSDVIDQLADALPDNERQAFRARRREAKLNRAHDDSEAIVDDFIDFMAGAQYYVPRGQKIPQVQDLLVDDDFNNGLCAIKPYSTDQLIHFTKVLRKPFSYVLEALGKKIVGRIEWRTQIPQMVQKGQYDVNFGISVDGKQGVDYSYMRFVERLTVCLSLKSDGGMEHYKLELCSGILFSFGKVKILGYPMPYAEPFVAVETDALLNFQGIYHEGQITAPHVVSQDIVTTPLTWGARFLAQFCEAAGLQWIFGYDWRTFSNYYFSDTHAALKLAQVSIYHAKKIKEVGDALMASAKKWASGAMTAREALWDAWDKVAPIIKKSYRESLDALVDETAVVVNHIKERLMVLIGLLKKYYKEVVGVLSIAAAAVAFYYSMGSSKHSNQSLADDFTDQDSSMRHDKYIQREAQSRRARVVKTKNSGSNANQASVHYIENVAETLRRNMWWQLGPSGKPIGTWLFIEKTRAVAPSHFLLAANDVWYDSDVYITLCKGEQKYEITKDQVVIVADLIESGRDLVIVDFLHPKFPPQRNIKNHFASPKDETMSIYKTAFRVDLFTLQRCVTDDAYNDEQVLVRASEKSRIAAELVLKNKDVRCNVITYAIPTLPGECGSVVVFKGKIVGIHAHGNGTLGSASRINAAMLEACYTHPDSEQALPMSEFEEFDYDRSGMGENQNYDDSVHTGLRVGVLDPPMNTFVSPTIVPWRPKDELQPTIVPVNAKVQNYPAARSKYGYKPFDIDQEVSELAVMAYKTYLLRLMKPSTFRRNLTFVEAVQGVPGTSISSLDNTTSPGFPYNYEKIKRDQIYKINENGEFVPGPLWPQLLSDAQVDVKLMCHDHVPAYVFSDNLKMELRAPEKVDKPRMIAGAPLLHTFLSRIHFGAFMAFMSDNNGLNDVLIGADPHVDWDFYQRKMTSVSDGVRECFGDFSGFDTSRAPEMMDFVAEIANAFYGDQPDSPVGKVRHWLVRSCVVSVHMYAKVLEQVSSGWCSGALLTGLGNSMFNTWAHVYAAVKTAKDEGLDYHLVAAEYFSNVYLKVMGDDCGMGVTEEFSFHNNASIAKVLGRDLALTYTSVKKSVDVVPFDPPEDRTLLKRESIFCEEDGVFYGCLQIEVILNMVCYTKRGDEIAVMRQRGDNAIKELAFRPAKDWNEYLPKILKKLGPMYVYRGYHQKELRRSCLIGWFTQSNNPTPNVVKLVNEARVASDLEAKTTSPSGRSSPSEGSHEHCGCNSLALCLKRHRDMENTNVISQRQCAGTPPPLTFPLHEVSDERALARVGDFGLKKSSLGFDSNLAFYRYEGFINQADTPNPVSPPVMEGVTSVTGSSNSTHNVTTKFADDSEGYEANIVANVGDVEQLVYDISGAGTTTIPDFLSRPTLLSNSVFSASDTGIIWSTDLTNVFSPPKQTRMSNIFTFKADFDITLQANADPFQQGRYILFWLPHGGILSPTDANSLPLWRNMHTCNLTKITQLPHVEIDLATQTHVTLHIPFTSVLPMVQWSTISSSMSQSLGIIGIIPYSPLDPGSGGSTVCGYSLFGSLQNIKLGSAAVNQSASTKEANAQSVGPMSSFVGKVGKAATIVGQIPALGSAMSTVSWFSKVVQDSLDVFGLSKPLALAAPMRMHRDVGTFNAVSDVAHYAKPLGLFSTNSVAVPPNMPTNVDEMSIDYLKKIAAFYQSFTWSAAASTGTLLWSTNVFPNYSTTWSKGTVHVPMSFIASHFYRWRGGIQFNFKLVKTKLQKGRLMVVFFPGQFPTTSFSQSELVYREVVDVSSTSSFSVCCPYVLPQPWQANSVSMGTLAVYVLDPLVAPTTVSSNVNILVEACGADDLQFSLPQQINYEPYAPSTAQMNEGLVETPCFELGPKVSKVNDQLTKYTSGEPVKSIRSLLKRNYNFYNGVNGAIMTLGGGNVNQVYPYAIYPVTQATGTSGALQRDVNQSDLINLWSCAYVFQTGSIRYVSRVAAGAGANAVETTAIPGATTKTAWYSATSGYARPSYALFSYPSIEGLIEVQSPSWNGTLARSVPAHFVNNTRALYMSEPTANCSNVLYGDSLASAYQACLSRSAADDFSLGLFIGVPPVVATTTT